MSPPELDLKDRLPITGRSAMHLLAQPKPPFAPMAFPPQTPAQCRVLAIDVDANCTRLIKGMGAGITELPSIAAARERLICESFDAVLLVACGYGHRALSVGEIGSIVSAANNVPVLVVVEMEDRNMARHALEAGAFDVLVRGAHDAADLRRRISEAVELSRLRAHRALIEQALGVSACAVVITDPQGDVEWCNEDFEHLSGYPRYKLLGKNVREFLRSGLHAEQVYQRLWQTISGGKVWRGELKNRRSDGSIRAVATTITPVFDGSGAIGHYIAVQHDMTERLFVASKLRIADCVAEHCQEGIVVTNADNEILQVNAAFTRITGYSEAEVLGRNPKLLSSGRQGADFYAALWQTLRQDGHWQGELWNRRKSGEVYAQQVTIRTIRDEHGILRRYVAIFSDINQLKLQADALDRIAHYDLLTGAANRRLLGERLQQAIAQARQTQRRLAVCYLDLDGFQPINDRFGHPTGDQVLIEITRRIEAVLREGDTLARLGGDEFVLLLGNLASHRDACLALDRVLVTIAASMSLAGNDCSVSSSIGVTLFPDDAEAPDILLRHADQAMLLAKEGGKNRYQFFDAHYDQEQRANRELRDALEHALANGEFVLFYQPKVNLASGRVWGVEALIRWQHPQRGLLPPGAFLPAVCGTRFEQVVGDWVIESALAQMAQWSGAGLDLEISVNISAPHLLANEFVPTLQRLLAAQPTASAHRLELEILESSAIEDIEQAARTVAECRALGVRFALDDFGTGFSSLTYFRRLGIETLKIDQSFVRDMLTVAEDRSIVESVIRLAQAFNRGVVAEGVESAECWPVLIALGCECAQGFSVAQPMPAGELPGWIASWQARRMMCGLGI